MANGDDDLAIEAFQTSLTMNPAQNVKDNSISLLGQLGEDYVVPELFEVNAADVEGFLGTYDVPQNNSTVQAEAKWDGTNLTFQLPGQGLVTLQPQSKTRFWAHTGGQMLGIEVEFSSIDHGVANEVLVRTPGNAQPVSAPRVQLEVAASHD